MITFPTTYQPRIFHAATAAGKTKPQMISEIREIRPNLTREYLTDIQPQTLRNIWTNLTLYKDRFYARARELGVATERLDKANPNSWPVMLSRAQKQKDATA